MSINIALIPIALVMRVVMGEEKFNDFVSQGEDVKYTKFKDYGELQKIINKAGYDFVEHFGILKTHFKGKDFFIWEIRDGYICAVFSVYDDKSSVADFINAFERIIGHKSFYSSLDSLMGKTTVNNTNDKKAVPQPKQILEQVFPTKFADKKLLIKTLKSIGLNCSEVDNNIICKNDNYILIFSNKNGMYEFKITGEITNKEAYQKYKSIDLKYGQITQQEVVDNIKKKAERNKNMKIEKEEILEDNSVLLTISI